MNDYRTPAERSTQFYVASVDEYQKVIARLSPLFTSVLLARAALKHVKGRKAVIVEETTQRFIHDAR